MKKPENKFLSRKFLLVILFAVVGLILVETGKLDANWLIGQLVAMLGIYNGSNVLDKINPTAE